ncbi:carboxypeptidase-like regulatory domain-containing protein [Bacillus sp. FJAT-27251]|uniref:carboxypeptidase-like regulatory domain-containing protein n=1 Tax=Bacillus sp. FJAT-27251 TaxID=1684142 RepID=UPI0006A7CCAD|nr:carboxypeptidase-like regulatory domain-containing protein [Bacillus sp. FJAT-27251]
MGKKLLLLFLLIAFVVSSSLGSIQPASANHIKGQKGSPPVEATVKDGKQRLKNTPLLISEKNRNSDVKFVVTDYKGNIKTRLADGSYSIKGLKGKENTWYSTNTSFSVADGKVASSKGKEITIKKKEKVKNPQKSALNFSGALTEGNKGLKGTLILFNMSGEYDEEIYTVSSNNKGQFSASLPDGEYYLFGIETDGGFYRYGMFFAVEGKTVVVDGEQLSSLNISLPVNAYTGKASDSSKPLSQAGIVLEKFLDEEEWDFEPIQYTTTNNKGEFALRELNDGAYALTIYHNTYQAWQIVKFTVENGKLFFDGEEVTHLAIKIPELTLKGTLLDGKKPVANAGLFIEGESTDGEYIDSFVPSDKNGNLQYRLPDGSYTVFSVDEENRSTYVSIPFEIAGGKIVQHGKAVKSLTVVLPPVTFTGKLVDEGTSLEGDVYVERLGEEGSYDWYHAITDENGRFSLRLNDGKYKIAGGFLFEDGEDFSLSTEFEIVGGKLYVGGKQTSLLEVQIPPVTLQGIVLDGGQAVNGGDLFISSADQNYYHWKSIREDGSFSMRLADGDYNVETIYLMDEGSSTPINMPFLIKDGKMYTGGENLESLQIHLSGVSLKGSLSEDGKPVMGDLSIMQVNEADYPIELWGGTSEDGVFKFRLPDGDYMVTNVYL